MWQELSFSGDTIVRKYFAAVILLFYEFTQTMWLDDLLFLMRRLFSLPFSFARAKHLFISFFYNFFYTAFCIFVYHLAYFIYAADIQFSLLYFVKNEVNDSLFFDAFTRSHELPEWKLMVEKQHTKRSMTLKTCAND